MGKFKLMEIRLLHEKIKTCWDKIMSCEKAYPEDIHAWLTVMLRIEKLMFDNIE